MVSSCLSLSPGMFWQELQKGTGTPKIRHLNHPGVWIFKQSSTRWGLSYSLSLEYIVQNLGVSSKAVNQWEKLVHSWGGGHSRKFIVIPQILSTCTVISKSTYLK